MNYTFAPAIGFKKLAFLYDPLVNSFHVGESLQKKTLQIASLKNGMSILDIGCGTGTLVSFCKKIYPQTKVVGLDPDENVLKIAKQKAKKNNVDVTFVASGAEELPFPDKSFDVITSSLAFHHLPTEIKKQALKEIYRVLKDNGTFLLIDIGKPKNLFWNIALRIESIVEPREYMKDNISGNIPLFIKHAGFHLEEARPPYVGIYFWKAKKLLTNNARNAS